MLNAITLLGSLGSTVLIKFWPKNLIKRQVIFSFTDLLGKSPNSPKSYESVTELRITVSIGGTAGLYLGFSVLGLVEFIYFFTMRLPWHIYGYEL